MAQTPGIADHAAPEQTASTPEPVVRAAASWGSVATLLVTAVGTLTTLGVLTSEQADAISALTVYVTENLVVVGTVSVGVVSLVSGVVGAFTTALVGRRKVSPVPAVSVAG